MWFVVGFVALGLALLAGNGVRRMSSINIKQPGVAQWELFVRAGAVARHIDPGFALGWIAVESGGNPCAVGRIGANGPDGQPQELGLFQLYNPDDLKLLGATGSELRAYCQYGTQAMTRQMTSAEVGRHIGLGLSKIQECMRVAASYLSAADFTWNPSQRDFWRAVKLVHALPSIVHYGFQAVRQRLGRAPATWEEFRAIYETIQTRAKYNPSLSTQDGYWRALENAEKTGACFEGEASHL